MKYPPVHELQTMPIADLHMWTIIRGLDGYPDDDTTRPMEVLRHCAEELRGTAFDEAGWTGPDINLADGVTVGWLRSWCLKKLGIAA